MDSFPGRRREKPGREYPGLSWRQPCLSISLPPRFPLHAQKTLRLSREEGQRLEKGPRSCAGVPRWAGAGSWSPALQPRVACSPVDGRDTGHCVIVADALSQEPVTDFPGEHGWVLSFIFSNLVHHFGCRHFGLGATYHSGLDAASLVVPAPGRPAGSARSSRARGRGGERGL